VRRCSLKAAWLHHRFTQIHPFQDGNGRVARTLASLIFIRQGLFPVVITRNDRQEYINASEAADSGNLTRLTKLFSRLQEKILIKGLGLRA
jgi:Fic family protein